MSIIKTGNTFLFPPLRLASQVGRRLAESISGILNSLDRRTVRLVLRLKWKHSQKAVAERIRAFEATEDDSAWQLLYACGRIENPKVKAQLFMQAMEEMHHAEVFRGLYEESSGSKLRKMSVPRKAIFQEGAAWKLFAYCAVGEASAARRFQHIADGLPAGPFQSSLRKILKEEEGHVELAADLGSLTGKTDGEIKRELARVKLVRAWESWLRLGRNLTNFMSRSLLSITYFGMGWWLKPKEDL